jgi:uncharacterized protein DUF6461
MGWRMAGLMVENRTPDDVLAVLPGAPRPLGIRLTGDEALSMSVDADYAVATLDGWTVVSDPGVRAWSETICEPLSSGDRRTLSFVVDDLTTTHGFAWYVDGHHVRTAFYLEGEPTDHDGDPLPAERNLPDPASEDHVPVLAARLTGLGTAELFGASYELHRATRRS